MFITVPKGILEGEMFLWIWGNFYCLLWKCFIYSNFLTGAVKIIVITTNISLVTVLFCCGNILSLVWKFFVYGVEIGCLWCRKFVLSLVWKVFFSGVEIFCSYWRIVMKRKISTPEMKNFHTRKEIFTQFGKLLSMPRTACLLELKELGVSHLSSDPKVVSSSPEPGSIVLSLTDGDSEWVTLASSNMW